MTKIEKVINGLECCNMPNNHDDCPYNGAAHYNICTHQLLTDSIALLKEQEWISVKDRLPEHGQTVLAWEASGFIYVDKYDGKQDVFKIAHNHNGTVTHWQSLPEPPKEGGIDADE